MAPSSRLRSYQYIPYLKTRGIAVDCQPLATHRYLENFYTGRPINWADMTRSYLNRMYCLLKCRGYDLLWIEHELFPWFPAMGEMLLNRVGIPYMVDYDDAVFHRYDRHPSMFLQRLFSGKIDRVMKAATLVIAGNRYLADRAVKAGAPIVEILPTVVDMDRYRKSAPGRDKKPFTIGWIGTPTTANYIKVAEPAISRFCDGGKARLVLVGSGPVSFKKTAATILKWSEDTEVETVCHFDVGIMPLPDNEWTRGKCGYKLIQYMACGVPVIASDVGVNSEIVDHGRNGYLAATASDWEDTIGRLRDDPDLRTRMGANGQTKVMEKYALQVTAPQLSRFIKSCVN